MDKPRYGGPSKVRIHQPPVLIPRAEWMAEGNCAGMDTELFYPPSEADVRSCYVKRAKAICSGCPVSTECLTWALKYDERGVWGATTQAERQRMTQRQRSIYQRSTP